MAGIGDNRNLTESQRSQMKGYIREIEHFEEQKREISTDISEIYKSAKENGFDTKAMRHVIKMRRMDADQRDAFENSVDAYKHALGMLADTPLGEAAIKSATDKPKGGSKPPTSEMPKVDTSDAPFHAPTGGR